MVQDPSDAGSHRRQRHRKALLSLGVSNAARLMRLGCQMLMVRWMLAHFGEVEYGLWVAMFVVLAYLALGSNSLGYSLMTRVAEGRGEERLEVLRDRISAALALTVLLAMGVATTTWLLVPHLSLTSFFGAPPELAGEAPRLFMVFVLMGCADLVLSQFLFAQQGFQEEYLGSAWRSLEILLNLLAVGAVIALDGTLVELAWLWLASLVVSRLGAAILFLRNHPECRPRWSGHPWRGAGPLISLALAYLAAGITIVISTQTDSLILAHFLGSQSVPAFSIPLLVVAFLLDSIHALSTSYWSGYTEAAARQDFDWIAAAFRRILIFSCATATVLALDFFMFGRDVLTLWVPQVSVSTLTLAMVCLYLPVATFSGAHGILLSGIGWVKQQLVPAAIGAALHLALAFWLVGTLKVEGVAVALTVPAALGGCTSGPSLVRWAFQGRVRTDFLGVARATVLPGAVAGAVALGVDRLTEGLPPLLRILGGCLATTAVFYAVARPVLEIPPDLAARLKGLLALGGRPAEPGP